MISGLAITDDNYNIAIRILRDRYDNASKQTNVLFQRFLSLLTPQHNAKDLRAFLTEYCKVKTQLSRVLDLQQSELVIKSIVVRKLTFQTFDRICDIYVTHDFTLKQMETGIQHIVDKLEQAVLALAEGANVKQVGVNSPPTKQSKQKANQLCLYCSGDHYSNECTKYKTVNSRKDRIMSLKLCYNCLTPGHSSKTCRSTKTYRTCGSHHHSSLCFKAHSNSSDTSNRTLVTLTQMSVKENRINPQLAPVALTNVTSKHKHKLTLTNPLLRLTKQTRVKLAINHQQSIPLT